MRINWSGFVLLLLLAGSSLPVGLVHAQESPTDYLPTTLLLPHADCFEIDGDGELDFSALLDGFENVPDAATVLHELGWQANAYRQFGCDNPPPGSAGWIDIGVHEFADAAGATAAARYFAETRALGTSLQLVPGATALTGPSGNGTEYTLYVSYDRLLFRVTGVAPVGSPQHDVEQVANMQIAGATIVPERDEQAAQQLGPFPYTVIDLGTGDGNWSSAQRINNDGLVLWMWGNARDSLELDARYVHDGHSMLSQPGATVDLRARGIDGGIAINDSSIVLGVTEGEFFLYNFRDGQTRPLSDPGSNSWFVDINNHGAVATSDFVIDAEGTFSPPVPDGYERLTLIAISNTGWIAGTASENHHTSAQRAVLIADEEVTVLGPAPGAAGSYAVDVNDLGQLIGNPERLGMHLLVQYGTAFVYDQKTRITTDIGTLPGYGNSTPAAINNVGQVVGAAWAPWSDTQSFRRAFLYNYSTAVMSDLNGLIDPASGWVLVDAYDINDAGQIVGRGFINGETHAFVLNPNK